MSTHSDTLELPIDVGAEGRITIPKRYRSFLDLVGQVQPVTIVYEGQELSTLLRVDQQGRATIPIDVREHLGVSAGDEVTLVFS